MSVGLLCVALCLGAGVRPVAAAERTELPELVVPPGTCVDHEPPPAPLDPASPAPATELPPAITVDPALPLPALIATASRAFGEEQYEIALAYLSAAYARSPLPPLLFNIAQTQRKAGYTRAALDTYRRFLATAGQSPLAPEASAHVAAMQAKLEAEQATMEKAAAEQRAHERAAQAERLAKERTAEREQAQRELRRALAQREGPVYKRKWFWGLMGGVVASTIVVGLGVGLAPKPQPEPVGDLPTQEPHF